MPADLVHVDINNVSVAFCVLGFFIVGYGLFSYLAKERLYLSEPLIATTVGIVVGPYVLGWVDPLSWGDVETTNYTTYQFTRLVVGVQVLFTGISLPKAYLRREAVSISILVLAIMTAAWLTTGLLCWGLVTNITFLEALTIAAAITPTDPVLANSITKGRFAEKHVPANVRNIILAESGANDGLGFPFLYLAIYLLARNHEDAGTGVGTEIGRWVYAVVIYQILLSCAYGALLGFIARKSLLWAEARQYIDKENFFAYGLGLALFVLGTTGLMGSDDILACFIAGNSFTWDDEYRIRSEESEVQDILDMLLNSAMFIYIGAILPWGSYSAHNAELGMSAWRFVLLGITVLLLRRPPWVIASTRAIPALRNYKESTFAGWFGPIGVGAVYYIQVALQHIPDDGSRDRLRQLYPPVCLFLVFSSILLHGLTIPLAKLTPNIVSRTATFTQSRSITLALQPASAGSSTKEGERVPWNPLLSLGRGLRHVFFCWEKDSFWRKEPTRSKSARTTLRASDVGAPKAPRKTGEANNSIFAAAAPGTEGSSEVETPNADADAASSEDTGTPPEKTGEEDPHHDAVRTNQHPRPPLSLPTTRPTSRAPSPPPTEQRDTAPPSITLPPEAYVPMPRTAVHTPPVDPRDRGHLTPSIPMPETSVHTPQ